MSAANGMTVTFDAAKCNAAERYARALRLAESLREKNFLFPTVDENGQIVIEAEADQIDALVSAIQKCAPQIWDKARDANFADLQEAEERMTSYLTPTETGSDDEPEAPAAVPVIEDSLQEALSLELQREDLEQIIQNEMPGYRLSPHKVRSTFPAEAGTPDLDTIRRKYAGDVEIVSVERLGGSEPTTVVISTSEKRILGKQG